MHQVLRRTRPDASAASQSSSKLRTFLRSFLAGKRGLVLLAIVSGTALTSHALHGLLRPGSERAPGSPVGSEGREESASAGQPTAKPAPVVAKSSDGAVRDEVDKGGRALRVQSGEASQRRSPAEGQPGSRGRAPAASRAASRPFPFLLGWQRSPRRGQPSEANQGIIAESGPDGFTTPGPAAPPARRSATVPGAQSGGRQLGAVTLSDLDPFQGVPCSDSTAALPSDRPPEEAWLPGSDASSALNAAALDPIPVPPIYSESPDQAAGPASASLQANRNTPCLLKQPAGRN